MTSGGELHIYIEVGFGVRLGMRVGPSRSAWTCLLLKLLEVFRVTIHGFLSGTLNDYGDGTKRTGKTGS